MKNALINWVCWILLNLHKLLAVLALMALCLLVIANFACIPTEPVAPPETTDTVYVESDSPSPPRPVVSAVFDSLVVIYRDRIYPVIDTMAHSDTSLLWVQWDCSGGGDFSGNAFVTDHGGMCGSIHSRKELQK